MRTCAICGDETDVVVNIDFQKVAVCDPCCLSITKQTVAAWNLPAVSVRDDGPACDPDEDHDSGLTEPQRLLRKQLAVETDHDKCLELLAKIQGMG
jgi:hypothetical protein